MFDGSLIWGWESARGWIVSCILNAERFISIELEAL